MENEEKMMSGEESLSIITEMINKTKSDIRQAIFHLLLWGWLLLGCSISEYLLYKFTDFATPWYVWFFVIPGVFVSMIYGYLTGRKLRFYTYASMIYMWTWISFLFAAVVLFIIQAKNMELFPSLVLTLAGMSTFISGVIIKFKPLILGGLSFWIFALVAHFAGYDISSISFPAAMLTGYLIPGYILKIKKGNNEVQRT
ncbi:MAG: hypothetical protein ACUVTX_05130 [Bacteroidales bacterium]